MAFTVDRGRFDAVLAELVENVKEHFASNGASLEVITHVEKVVSNKYIHPSNHLRLSI